MICDLAAAAGKTLYAIPCSTGLTKVAISTLIQGLAVTGTHRLHCGTVAARVYIWGPMKTSQMPYVAYMQYYHHVTTTRELS